MEKNKFHILPIGGIEEIGSNITLYAYNTSAIIVDYGIGLHTIDDITPYSSSCINFLSLITENVGTKNVNIVITHCHDDHVGGLKFIHKMFALFDKNNITLKIYVAHDYIKDVILSKTEGNSLGQYIVVTGSKYYTQVDQHLSFKFYEVEHSTPHSYAIHIKQFDEDKKEIKVLHTGDWRLNPGPTHKCCKSLTTFRALANKCDIVVNESTKVDAKNAVNHSEADVVVALEAQITRFIKKGKRVYITLFASSIERVANIVRIAMKNKFSIGYMGYTMNIFVTIAHKYRILSDEEHAYLTSFSNIEKLLASKIQIKLVSGCQNENNSILNRITYSKLYQINGNDAVIFSSMIIPSVRKRVEDLYRMLDRHKVYVVNQESVPHIHCSGHATRDDMIQMYEIIKPKFAIPVHGNIIKIREHSELLGRLNIGNMRSTYLKYCSFAHQDGSIKLAGIFTMNAKYFKKMHSLNYDMYPENSPVIDERKKLILGGAVVIDANNKAVYTIGHKMDMTKINNAVAKLSGDDFVKKIKSMLRTYSGALLVI